MSIAEMLRSSTLPDRWKIFANVRDYPQDFVEISQRAGVPPTKTVAQLQKLEEDGLVRIHSRKDHEWVLA